MSEPIWIRTDWDGKTATGFSDFNGPICVDGSSQAHAISKVCGRIARRKGGKGRQYVTNTGISGIIGDRAFELKSLEVKSFDRSAAAGLLI